MARPTTIGRFLCASGLVPAALLGLGCADRDAPSQADLSSLDPAAAGMIRRLEDAARPRVADAQASGELGLAYETYGLLTAAEEAFSRAATLAPDEPRWHYHRARILAAVGDPEAGLLEMDRAIALAPDYAPAHWHSGQWLLELDEPVLAELAFTQALAHDPSALAARVGLARAYLATDRPEEARALLLQSLQDGRAGGGAQAYLQQLLGSAYRQLGRLDDAATALALATPVTPSWSDPWREGQEAYRIGYAADLQRAMDMIAGGTPARAIPGLERLRLERPNDVTLLSNLGAAYLDVGRAAEGKQTLLTALGYQPEHFGSHLNLSAAFEREGRIDLALEHVDRALATNPFLGRAHERRGGLLLRLLRFDEALAAFEAARERDPARLTATLGAGQAQAGAGRHEQARLEFQTVVDRQPGNLRAWLGLARAEAESGHRRAAQNALRAASTLAPDHPDVAALSAWVEDRGARPR